MATRRALAAVVAAGMALAGGVVLYVTADSSGVSVLVPDAAFPAAMAALPDGGVLYGERFTGRIIEVDVDGSTKVVGRVGEIYASFTADDPERRITVQRLGDDSTVWLGPPSADRANGGRIAFAPDGSLVIGVGDLLDPIAARNPDTPNGKLLALDPEGPPEQTPRAISSGWNNPFAFAFAEDGTLYVADNAGGEGAERLAIGNAGPGPVVLATLPSHSVPSGLAVTGADELVVCTYLTRSLTTYRVQGDAASLAEPAAVGLCSIGVVSLADGSLALADETSIGLLLTDSSDR